MPVSGPVYQPTTVTYQQQPNARWNCPMSYFTQRLTNSLNHPKCIKYTMCAVGFIIGLIGLGMLIDGSMRYGQESITVDLNNNTSEFDTNDTSEHPPNESGKLSVVVMGSILLVIGAIIAVGFAYSARKVSRQSGGAGSGGAGAGGTRANWLVRAWNRRTNAASTAGGTPMGPAPAACPSTDPLVHAAQPPANDDERRNLMDNKDCLSSAEESDKMLDSEFRVTIVTGA